MNQWHSPTKCQLKRSREVCEYIYIDDIDAEELDVKKKFEYTLKGVDKNHECDVRKDHKTGRVGNKQGRRQLTKSSPF